jgi:two-component system, LuxR family, response regulator FixJ
VEGLIYIVDDDATAREELVELVASAGYVAHAMGSGAEFLEFVRPDRPSCVLLDLNMPGSDGFAVQTAIAARELPTAVIMVSGAAAIAHAVRAARAGAVQFLEKPCRRSDVIDAITEGLAIARARESETRAGRDARERIGRLAPRELDVLSGLVAGLSSKQIAYHLGLSPRTVELYRGKLTLKVGVKSLPLLIRLAIEAGIAPLAIEEERHERGVRYSAGGMKA